MTFIPSLTSFRIKLSASPQRKTSSACTTNYSNPSLRRRLVLPRRCIGCSRWGRVGLYARACNALYPWWWRNVVSHSKAKGQKNIHWKTPKESSVSWLHFTAHGISMDASNEDKALREGRPRLVQLATGPLLDLTCYRPSFKNQNTFDAAVLCAER